MSYQNAIYGEGDPLPVTQRQMSFARTLALRNGVTLPWEVQQDRHSLSRWIDAQQKAQPMAPGTPSSRQIAFAEQIARRKRISVPEACFKDRETMSLWINRYK